MELDKVSLALVVLQGVCVHSKALARNVSLLKGQRYGENRLGSYEMIEGYHDLTLPT